MIFPDRLLENVAFSLHLQNGRAIRHITTELESLGYYWTYRVLDTQEFGLPQRRRRVFVVANLDADPTPILFDGICSNLDHPELEPASVGFYWTEGNRGLGWTPEAIPPLKGGSNFSIPSPPAIWNREDQSFFSPGIKDAERLQGFTSNWTAPVSEIGLPDRVRWRLVGNAVSVPVARWIGKRLTAFDLGSCAPVDIPQEPHSRCANIGWGGPGRTANHTYIALEGPSTAKRALISEFVFKDSRPLSIRAASGFLARLVKSPLVVENAFKVDLALYSGRRDLY